MKICRVALVLFVTLYLFSASGQAEPRSVVVIAEGSYSISCGETATIAIQRAFVRATQVACEQACVYVENYSRRENIGLTKEEISIVTSALGQPAMIEQEKFIEDDGVIRYWCKVNCEFELDRVLAYRFFLNDRRLVDQYDELQGAKLRVDKDNYELKALVLPGDSKQVDNDISLKLRQNETQFFVYQRVEKAYFQYVARNYGEAAAIASQALAIDNKNTSARLLRGNSYQRLGEIGKAVANYSEIISQNPNCADAYFARGMAYGGNGQHDEAIADMTKAIQMNWYVAEAYYYRGIAKAEKGQYANAVADFTLAIGAKTEFPEAYYYRGCSFSGFAKYNEAIADFSKAIVLRRGYFEAYCSRGLAFAAQGDYDLAIADFTQALRIDYRAANVYYYRGHICGELGKPELAIADYSRAIKLNPKYAAAYNDRGSAYILIHEYDKAYDDFNSAICLDLDFANAYYNRGMIYWLRGDKSAARADWNRYSKLGGTGVFYEQDK